MPHDERGREIPDPTPVEVPLRFRGQESTDERIRRIIRETISRQAAESGWESFDDANDFDVDEDPDPVSQYELTDMQEERAFDEPSASPPVNSGATTRPPTSSSGDRAVESGEQLPERGQTETAHNRQER